MPVPISQESWKRLGDFLMSHNLLLAKKKKKKRRWWWGSMIYVSWSRAQCRGLIRSCDTSVPADLCSSDPKITFPSEVRLHLSWRRTQHISHPKEFTFPRSRVTPCLFQSLTLKSYFYILNYLQASVEGAQPDFSTQTNLIISKT